jgi:hypothetical protein
LTLFPKERTVGVFRGFSEGGLEFHADLILKYKIDFQSVPMHGQFILVQLETQDEGVLGRITGVLPMGKLASDAGDDYGLRAVAEERDIPENLLDQYLKYKIDIRVLGVIRNVQGKFVFAASHRRLPHVGSKVAFLSDDMMREIAGHNEAGAELGFLAFGEFIYSGSDARLKLEPWMIGKAPAIIPRFDVTSLVARRSFVFARAGFGKSNLVKLLFSNLYAKTPTVMKRGNRQVPVGTVIFDPDGEYFWPDDKGRPGLCDVPVLRDQIAVFTSKAPPSDFYGSFIVSNIKLDIRRLRPSHVLSIALSPERQDQQNVRKLKQLSNADWSRLVDAIHQEGNNTDPNLIREIARLDERQDPEMLAARANMTQVVTMLHDPSSQMLDLLLRALRDGKICVVDVSQMRGAPATALSGIILQHVFNHNQTEFTKAQPETIPTIAVLEEAQTVLGNTSTVTDSPYVAWVKEGRKYDLGAVMISQQPGSISWDLLSQGDNWFIFHLLSSGDLQSVKKANAHFSDDILSALLNEPLPGHGVFWSSAAGKSYPLSVRVLSFEDQYQPLDPTYKGSPIECYAVLVRTKFADTLSRAIKQTETPVQTTSAEQPETPQVDALGQYLESAIQAFCRDAEMLRRLTERGVPWKGVLEALKAHLPNTMDDRDDVAHHNVAAALNRAFGEGKWATERRESKGGPGMTTWVIITDLH